MSCGPFELDCRQIAAVLHVRPTKVAQALYASVKADGLAPFDKMVLMMMVYPQETFAAIAKRMAELRALREHETAAESA